MANEKAHRLTPLNYAIAYAALLALTALTFGMSFLSLGHWEWLVALGIALIKAAVVALFFMHLIESSASHRMAAVVAVLLLATMILLTMADVRTRDYPSVTPVQARELERQSSE